jgi:hypothetical protein
MCTGWCMKFNSIFIGFHTFQVCLLFLKLLAHYRSSVILCNSLVVRKLWGKVPELYNKIYTHTSSLKPKLNQGQ